MCPDALPLAATGPSGVRRPGPLRALGRPLLVAGLALALLPAAVACQQAGEPTPSEQGTVHDTASGARPADPAGSGSPRPGGTHGTGTDDAAPRPGAAPLLERALTLARRDHPRLDADAVRDEIADLARRWRALLPADPTPVQRADTFARLLFDEAGFEAVTDLESPETLHVDSVLAGRRGYCLSLSVVALAVADVLGEPLHGVALPNHFLVRWDDGSTRRNLELTRRGRAVSDEELLAPLGPFASPDGAYGRNLSLDEVEAVLLHNRAFVASGQGRHEQALADLERAAALLPGLGEIHRTRGVVLGELERWEPAIAALEQALRVFPLDVDALLNLALCRQASGDLTGALEELELVLLLDPSRTRARELADHWRADAAYAAGDLRPLDDPPPDLRPGLLGTYFAGRRFDRAVTTRVDATLDFDWKRGRPIRGVPDDDFSVRWTGWFRAPRSGHYTLYVVGNDGVRLRFGDQLAFERWRDTGYTSWTDTGTVDLLAGWHTLVVEYYDRRDNARFVCLVSVEGDEYPLELAEHLFYQAP